VAARARLYFANAGELPPELEFRALALYGADLCEHREHVEVLREVRDLPAFDLEDLACREFERLVRCRNDTRWCLQRPAVNALPHDLKNGGVPARELVHECGLGVGEEGLRPALPGLDDLAGETRSRADGVPHHRLGRAVVR
jgi:hypothetical protein